MHEADVIFALNFLAKCQSKFRAILSRNSTCDSLNSRHSGIELNKPTRDASHRNSTRSTQWLKSIFSSHFRYACISIRLFSVSCTIRKCHTAAHTQNLCGIFPLNIVRYVDLLEFCLVSELLNIISGWSDWAKVSLVRWMQLRRMGQVPVMHLGSWLFNRKEQWPLENNDSFSSPTLEVIASASPAGN